MSLKMELQSPARVPTPCCALALGRGVTAIDHNSRAPPGDAFSVALHRSSERQQPQDRLLRDTGAEKDVQWGELGDRVTGPWAALMPVSAVYPGEVPALVTVAPGARGLLTGFGY